MSKIYYHGSNQKFKKMGYDGIAIPEEHHFGVFEPEQIHIVQENYEDFKYLNEGLHKIFN